MSHPGYISWAQSRGTKLGYYRASVSCDYCRKRKRRCRPGPAGDGGGCGNCVRLGRKCVAVKVEVMKALDSLGEAATPDSIARAQRSIGHIKSNVPVAKQMADYQPSTSSGSQFQARLRYIAEVSQGSMLSQSNHSQSSSALTQPSMPASARDSFPTSEVFHSQAIGHGFPNTQYAPLTTTSSTFNESPDYLGQGQQLQTEFGFHIPANMPFPDWTDNEMPPFQMLAPMTNNLWDLNVVTESLGRDAMAWEQPSWRPGNSFK